MVGSTATGGEGKQGLDLRLSDSVLLLALEKVPNKGRGHGSGCLIVSSSFGTQEGRNHLSESLEKGQPGQGLRGRL